MSNKNAKYRVKNAEGSYDVVHLETSASQVIESEEKQFVSAEKKVQYDENTIFTTDMLTVNALGGIKANEDLNNLSVKALLTKLLYPYVQPTISGSSSPNGGTFEFGDAKNVTNIRAVVGKKSEKITKVEVYDGSTLLGSKTQGVENGGTFDFPVDVTVASAKNFQVKATDATNKVVSANTPSFSFVYPYYYGVCGENDTIDEALVKGLTKKIEAKGNKTNSYNCNFQRMIIAYPKSYGKLKSIIDPNNFDVTGTFGVQEISITGLNGSPQAYYVYVNSPSTVANFNMKFNY